jgi:hypothetical protein
MYRNPYQIVCDVQMRVCPGSVGQIDGFLHANGHLTLNQRGASVTKLVLVFKQCVGRETIVWCRSQKCGKRVVIV